MRHFSTFFATVAVAGLLATTAIASDDDRPSPGRGDGYHGWMHDGWMGRWMHGDDRRGGYGMGRFGVVDANDDGRISDDEAAAQREAVFVAMDADDDGELTEEEFMAVRMGPGYGRNEERREARQAAKKARFAPMDADNSGKVSKAEFMAEGKTRFEAADVDKDGVVTPWEFRSQHRN